MRDWLKELDEIDRDCVRKWEHFLRMKFNSRDEYRVADALIDDMILDYETKRDFTKAYPTCEKEIRTKLTELREGKTKILYENANAKVIRCIDSYEVLTLSNRNYDGVICKDWHLQYTYGSHYCRDNLGRTYSRNTDDPLRDAIEYAKKIRI